MPKQAWEKFRQKEPTQIAEVVIKCFADKRMFLPNFEDMPKEMQNIFLRQGSISLPCQGSGAIGVWCNECVFGEIAED
jgi:hypothetical protein